jgi:cyclic beta-1,2-glucan synthetase
MDFSFLYKEDKHLFAIGCNLTLGHVDVPSYDLLASEASLTSFLTIARGDVPVQHWFHLGRLVTMQDGHATLVSWGGTMFEYLMPTLLLRLDAGTLLSESVQGAIARQIEYGRETRVPWGISESAYSSQNINFDYQYQSFGVPGLGLKRDLGEDLVVAPYATALAAPFVPHAATANLRALQAAGAAGRFGFYEAVDYTNDRLPDQRRHVVVRCFMAHHQGMSLVALTNAILDAPMQRRFHAEPMVRATALLLQERAPASVAPTATQEATPSTAGDTRRARSVSRRLTSAHTIYPRTHLMSNGAYSVMLTNAGAGYSLCNGLQVTRWRDDTTRDHWGQFIYLRDVRSGHYWSAGYQPTCKEPDHYEVIFSLDKAEIRRLDDLI